MAKHYPQEFRDDVVKVARLHQSPMSQIAKDFGISYATLFDWMKKADIEDGTRPGVSASEAEQNRELRRRNRVLEQEVEILRRATAYFAKGLAPK